MYLRALDKVNQQLQEVRSELGSTGVKIVNIEQKEDSCEVVVRISNNDFHYPFLNEHIRAKCSGEIPPLLPNVEAGQAHIGGGPLDLCASSAPIFFLIFCGVFSLGVDLFPLREHDGRRMKGRRAYYMLRSFVHVSFLFFSLVALTGAWMR